MMHAVMDRALDAVVLFLIHHSHHLFLGWYQYNRTDRKCAGRNDRTYISKSIQNEITGLGPLEELINDSTVSEIMVNGPNQIYVERKGKLVLSDVKFQDEEHVRRIIDRIVTPLGRKNR